MCPSQFQQLQACASRSQDDLKKCANEAISLQKCVEDVGARTGKAMQAEFEKAKKQL